jgi:uncharacterized protein (TIGR00369 family)
MSLSDIHAEAVMGSRRPAALVSLPGIERMRLYLSGRLSDSPLAYLTGLRMSAVFKGAATYVMPVTPWLRDAHGQVGLGAIAVVADAALGGAIQTLLDPGQLMVTTSLSLSTAGAIPSSGELRAEASVTHCEESVALSEVAIKTQAGALVARGMCRCVAIPAPVPADAAAVVGEIRARPARPGPPAAWEGRTAPYRRPAPEKAAVHHLLGLRPIESQPGSTRLAMAASPWLAAPTGAIQGGVGAWLAEEALKAAAQSAERAAARPCVEDLHVRFVRPAMPGDGALCGVAEILQTGRRRATGRVEVERASGKLAATALGGCVFSED